MVDMELDIDKLSGTIPTRLGNFIKITDLLLTST